MKTNELVSIPGAAFYGLAFGMNDLQLTMPCKVQMSKNLRETTHSPRWAALSILLRPNSIIPAAVNWIVVEVCNLKLGFLWIAGSAGARGFIKKRARRKIVSSFPPRV